MERGNSWTPGEESWLRRMYPDHHNAELSEMHAEAFPDRPRRTDKAINSRAKVWGLKKREGFVRNPRRFWTEEKREWFKAYVPGHHEGEISAEHERLYGTPLTASQIGNMKVALGVKSGTDGGRIRKGNVPPNKGKTWDEIGYTPEQQERMRANQFKPGQVNVPEWRDHPVGYERVNAKDGYTYVKVRDSRADGLQRQEKGNYNENFRLKHHVVWEQANGRPVPPSTMIVFADRDKTNFDPDNLVAVPRRLWSIISRNRMAYHDRESLEACMAIAELDSRLHRARCAPRACKACGERFEPRYPHQRRCDKCLGRD